MSSRPSHAPEATESVEDSTRTRLVDVAEVLFAEHGFASTSLRRITSEAGANLAAVNYHFGSKSGLIEAVFARRIRPLNEERMRRLKAVQEAAGERSPTLEAILVAFLAPTQTLCCADGGGGASFLRLMALANLEPTEDVHRLVYGQFLETGMRFHSALQAALPHLTAAEIFVRFRYLIGAMFFTFARVLDPSKLELPEGFEWARPRGSMSEEIVLADLVAFVAAGFRAPASDRPDGGGA